MIASETAVTMSSVRFCSSVKFAGHRKRPPHIGHVIIELGAHIEDHELTVSHRAVAPVVVRKPGFRHGPHGVRPRLDDGGEGNTLATSPLESAFQHRFPKYAHSRPSRTARAVSMIACAVQCASAAHDFDLFRPLDHPKLRNFGVGRTNADTRIASLQVRK